LVTTLEQVFRDQWGRVLAVPGRAELDAWPVHLDALGVSHGPVRPSHHGDVVAVHDPDGIEIRLYTTDPPKR
jgi:catechol 2,3-dioxygenase-like lactoylglutathione lyase family enzyme